VASGITIMFPFVESEIRQKAVNSSIPTYTLSINKRLNAKEAKLVEQMLYEDEVFLNGELYDTSQRLRRGINKLRCYYKKHQHTLEINVELAAFPGTPVNMDKLFRYVKRRLSLLIQDKLSNEMPDHSKIDVTYEGKIITLTVPSPHWSQGTNEKEVINDIFAQFKAIVAHGMCKYKIWYAHPTPTEAPTGGKRSRQQQEDPSHGNEGESGKPEHNSMSMEEATHAAEPPAKKATYDITVMDFGTGHLHLYMRFPDIRKGKASDDFCEAVLKEVEAFKDIDKIKGVVNVWRHEDDELHLTFQKGNDFSEEDLNRIKGVMCKTTSHC